MVVVMLVMVMVVVVLMVVVVMVVWAANFGYQYSHFT